MKTSEEIKAQVKEIEDEGYRDFFGAERTELIRALPFEDAKPYVKEGTTEESWAAYATDTDEKIREAAADYLSFAVGKATDHRGLSAERSVDHFIGWVFLIAGEDGVAQVKAAEYQNYGVPQLKKAAELIGIQEAWDRLSSEELENMAQGEPCKPGCYEGCGA